MSKPDYMIFYKYFFSQDKKYQLLLNNFNKTMSQDINLTIGLETEFIVLIDASTTRHKV